MATTVKTGWLHDKNGDKFAPKTLTSQVQTNDGVFIEDKIQSDLDAIKIDILEEVNLKVPISRTINGKPLSDNIVLSASDIDTVMPKTGGTFTGAIILNGAPTEDLHPATKAYVDSLVGDIESALEALL